MLEYQKSSAAPSPFTCECLFRHFALLVPFKLASSFETFLRQVQRNFPTYQCIRRQHA
jgi:hypothetical protein